MNTGNKILIKCLRVHSFENVKNYKTDPRLRRFVLFVSFKRACKNPRVEALLRLDIKLCEVFNMLTLDEECGIIGRGVIKKKLLWEKI